MKYLDKNDFLFCLYVSEFYFLKKINIYFPCNRGPVLGLSGTPDNLFYRWIKLKLLEVYKSYWDCEKRPVFSKAAGYELVSG